MVWNPATGFMMPARNVVIEGSYRINSYTVTYKGGWRAVYGEPEAMRMAEVVQLKPEPLKKVIHLATGIDASFAYRLRMW